MLGLLVTPSHAAEVALPALGLAFVLILVARPVAVLVCLAPERFRLNERAFIGWMGLRGAVPIFLGAFPVLAGVENANLYFSAAFAVVIASLVIQGWTAGPVARLFNVAPPLARGGNLANAGMIAVVAVGFTLASAVVSFGANERGGRTEPIAPLNVRELLAALGPEGSSGAIRLESFPSDWESMDPAARRDTFARVAAGLVAAQNERIVEEREQLLVMRAQQEAGIALSLPQQARRDSLARRYGGRYDDLDDLLARVDVVPPSLGGRAGRTGHRLGQQRNRHCPQFALWADPARRAFFQPDRGGSRVCGCVQHPPGLRGIPRRAGQAQVRGRTDNQPGAGRAWSDPMPIAATAMLHRSAPC